MAVEGKFYSQYYMKALNKEIGWLTDNIRCMFCTSVYVPDKDAHAYKGDVVGEVAGFVGYTIGGVVLNNRTMSYNPGTNSTIIDADDIELYDVTLNGVRTLVIYADTGDPATSPLIGFIDLGVDRGVTNGVFAIQWSPNGVFSHTANP